MGIRRPMDEFLLGDIGARRRIGRWHERRQYRFICAAAEC